MKKQRETVQERMTREGLTMDAALQEAIRERDEAREAARRHHKVLRSSQLIAPCPEYLAACERKDPWLCEKD